VVIDYARREWTYETNSSSAELRDRHAVEVEIRDRDIPLRFHSAIRDDGREQSAD